MKHIQTSGKHTFFKPLLATASVQAAMMVLKPGQSSSDQATDEHPKAEQWLLVLSGAGRAKAGKGQPRSIALKPGSLLLIEKREPHQITNPGPDPLVTISFYAPPAYTPGGEVRAGVKRRRRP